MTIQIFKELEQGSDEWFAARCGLLTASEVKLILTPTLKVANNDKTRTHVYELLAQRISNYVEPHYIGDEMLRGHVDEVFAREKYSENYEPVNEVGFITRDFGNFKIGFSPDGLVGDDGLIEVKSRRQKFQIQTIAEMKVPDEFMLQIQTGLLVSGRKWCDYISYSGGLHMNTIRVFPLENYQLAIIEAAKLFEDKIREVRAAFLKNMESPDSRLIETERVIEVDDEIIV